MPSSESRSALPVLFLESVGSDAHGERSLVLPLRAHASVRSKSDDLAAPVQVHAYADYAVRFSARLLIAAAFGEDAQGAETEKTSFNLTVNGELVPTRLVRESDDLFRLIPISAPGDRAGAAPLFSSAIGFAELSVQLRAYCADVRLEGTLASGPIEVLLPEGPLAANLAAMARFVAEHYERLLSVAEVQDADDPLHGRSRAFEEVLHAFERELPYFRSNARFLFTRRTALVPIAKAGIPSKDSAAYLASHPDALEPAPVGQGIRVNGRSLLPKHIPVDTVAKSGATFENLSLAAFLIRTADTLARDEKTLAQALDRINSFRAPDGFVSAAEPMFAQRAQRILAFSERLGGIRTAFDGLSKRYRLALDLADRPDSDHRCAQALAAAVRAAGTLPRRSEVFRGIGPYRRLYEAMARWFSLEELAFEKEKALSAFLSRSRFYEVFVLMKLLGALEKRGFRLVEKWRFDYEDALAGVASSRSQTTNSRLQSANTFVFVPLDSSHDRGENSKCCAAEEGKNEGEQAASEQHAKSGVYPSRTGAKRIIVYYEPIIRMSGEEQLNGIGLCRTSAFAVSLGSAPASSCAFGVSSGSTGYALSPLRSGSEDKAVYTPDIVVSVSDGVRRRWFVADAKYSTIAKAAADFALPALFKYLYSMSPTNASDETAGLWLLCGKEDAQSNFPGSLNEYGAVRGARVAQDVRLECVSGLCGEDGPRGLADAVVDAFCREPA